MVKLDPSPVAEPEEESKDEQKELDDYLNKKMEGLSLQQQTKKGSKKSGTSPSRMGKLGSSGKPEKKGKKTTK